MIRRSHERSEWLAQVDNEFGSRAKVAVLVFDN